MASQPASGAGTPWTNERSLPTCPLYPPQPALADQVFRDSGDGDQRPPEPCAQKAYYMARPAVPNWTICALTGSRSTQCERANIRRYGRTWPRPSSRCVIERTSAVGVTLGAGLSIRIIPAPTESPQLRVLAVIPTGIPRTKRHTPIHLLCVLKVRKIAARQRRCA